MAPEVASAASSASAYLTRPSLESFERVTIALRCLWPTRSASVFGERRVHDLCHPPASRCAAASGTRQRTAPTKGGGGCPARRRGLVTSADGDAPAGREARDAAAAGVTRTAPAMRHAAPSLQRCTVRMTAMWASRATCRELHRDERHLSGRREEHGGLPPRGRACDVAESCNGVSDTCPADGFVVAGTVCRAAASQCDMAETYTGTSAACPSDGFKP